MNHHSCCLILIALVLLSFVILPVTATKTVDSCGYIESIGGDRIRIAEAASGWRNPKTGNVIEVKITSRTLVQWPYGSEEEKKIEKKVSDLVWEAAPFENETVKKEIALIVAQNVNEGDKVIFSYDPNTNELYSLQIVPENFNIHIEDGVATGTSSYTIIFQEWMSKFWGTIKRFCGGA